MDNRLEVEFLGDGPADHEPRRDRRPRAGRRLHPLGGWTRSRRIAAAVAGATLLAGAGMAAVRLLPTQPLPTVLVNSSTNWDLPPHYEGPWQPGDDGRPATDVTLALTASVTRTVPPGAGGYADAELHVLGLAGPGVIGNGAPPTAVPAGPRPVEVPMLASIDCSDVPETAPDGAYGLRVRASFASRQQSQIATNRVAARSWAESVLGACSAWTARRALTIAHLTARPRPGLPTTLDVSFTVANSGDRHASLTDFQALGLSPGDSGAPTITGQLPVRIPPHGSAVATVALEMDACDVASPWGPGPALSDRVGLIASSGAERPGLPGDLHGPTRGTTGVVLSDEAATALHQGLVAACGGIEPPTLSVPAGGVRSAPTSGEILMDVDVRLTPGRVVSLRLEPGTSSKALLADDGASPATTPGGQDEEGPAARGSRILLPRAHRYTHGASGYQGITSRTARSRTSQ